MMNLREEIINNHSKASTSRIVKWIGDDQERFDELFNLFINDEPVIRQRAAWSLSYAVIEHHSFIQKHFSKLLKNLRQPGLHDSIKRNTMRLLQVVSIPKRYQGEVMNTCFDYIISPTEKPAIKAFSLTVLENLAKQYPEIRQELNTIIQSQWDNESAAFRSRARKILKTQKV